MPAKRLLKLFHPARIAWAPTPADPKSPYSWPSYDIEKLADALAAHKPGRTVTETRFYTGVPGTVWIPID